MTEYEFLQKITENKLFEKVVEWIVTKELEKSLVPMITQDVDNSFLQFKETFKHIQIAGRTVTIQVLEKVLQKLKDQNRDALINLKMITPILENISREPDTPENAPLLSMWQGLLESALTDETMSYGYADVLKQINAFEVRILTELFIVLKDKERTVFENVLDTINDVYHLNLSQIELDKRGAIVFINLRRLGILEADEVYHFQQGLLGNEDIVLDGGTFDKSTQNTQTNIDKNRNLNVLFTVFGKDFMHKCQGIS